MRLLHAQCIEASLIVIAENRIVLWVLPQPLRDREIGRQRIHARHVVVVARQAEVFPDPPRGITVVIRKSGRQACVPIQYLGAIRLRPILEERQHAPLEIGNFHILPRSVRQPALPCLQAGHNGGAGFCQPLLVSLVIPEPEHLIFDDRASQRSAKLVPLERRGIDFSVSVPVYSVEIVPGIQCAVPQVLEDGSSPPVRSRCGHHGDLSAGPLAVLRAIGVAQDVVFAHRVHAEQLLAGPLRRNVLAGRVVPNIVHAVNREAVAFRPLASHRE